MKFSSFSKNIFMSWLLKAGTISPSWAIVKLRVYEFSKQKVFVMSRSRERWKTYRKKSDLCKTNSFSFHFHLAFFSRAETETKASSESSRRRSSFYCTYRISGAVSMFLFSYHSTHAKIDHKVREKFDLFANDRGFLFPKSLDLLEPLRGNNTSSDLSCAIGDCFHQLYWNNISLSPTDTFPYAEEGENR